MQLQVIGKVRLALSPFEPQWANVPLYLTGRGVTTSTIPHPSGEVFDIDVDFLDHRVAVRTGSGRVEHVQLQAPVAAFYAEMMDALARAEVPVEISTLPSEVPDPIPFPGRHRARDVRRRGGDAVLASAARHRSGVARVPRQLPRKDAAGAALVGLARPHHVAVLGPPRRDAARRGRDHAPRRRRGVLLRRVLARRPSHCRSPRSSPTCIRSRTASSRRRGGTTKLGEFVLPYDDVRQSGDPRARLLEFVDGAFDVCWTAGDATAV